MTKIAVNGPKFVGEPTVLIGCTPLPVFLSPMLFEEFALPEYE